MSYMSYMSYMRVNSIFYFVRAIQLTGHLNLVKYLT